MCRHNLFVIFATINEAGHICSREVEHVSRIGKKGIACSFAGKSEEKNYIRNLRVDGRLRISKKYYMRAWTGLIWLMNWASGGLL